MNAAVRPAAAGVVPSTSPALTASPFVPRWWQRGGHVQTLLGFAYRRRLTWRHPTEDIVVRGDEDVRLLLRASFQPDVPGDRPTLLLIHGLGGWDAASYGLATGQLAWSRGWNVVRMNMRGAGGGEALCPRLYHAGLDCDLLSVLSALGPRAPAIAVVGFSLGANLALLAAGRNTLPDSVRAIVAVCPPVDLAACVASIERPANALYQAYFLRNLRASYERRRRTLPHDFPDGLAQRARSIREWDALITAPRGGFRDVEHYYADSSSAPHLPKIDRPALLLAAADDPMVPAGSFRGLAVSPHVSVEVTATGGHVGFVADTIAPGRFWAGERALAFAERVMTADATVAEG